MRHRGQYDQGGNEGQNPAEYIRPLGIDIGAVFRRLVLDPVKDQNELGRKKVTRAMGVTSAQDLRSTSVG